LVFLEANQVLPPLTDSGEIKMVLDLLDPATLGRVVGMVVLMVLAAAYGYSKGHRDGSREGYTRGRAVSRHISTINKAVK
jgi:hypothetical protein